MRGREPIGGSPSADQQRHRDEAEGAHRRSERQGHQQSMAECDGGVDGCCVRVDGTNGTGLLVLREL